MGRADDDRASLGSTSPCPCRKGRCERSTSYAIRPKAFQQVACRHHEAPALRVALPQFGGYTVPRQSDERMEVHRPLHPPGLCRPRLAGRGRSLGGPIQRGLVLYLHTFPPRSIEKLRLTITRSGDTGRRMSSPNKAIVPEGKRISYLRAIEVYAAKSEAPSPQHISRLIKADFRLPVWRNRDQASLWIYPTRSFREAADIELAFLAKHGVTFVPGSAGTLRSLTSTSGV